MQANSRGMDRRIIAQLFDSIDSLIQASKDHYQRPATQAAAELNSSSVAESAADSSANLAGAVNSNSSDKTSKTGFVVLIVATNK